MSSNKSLRQNGFTKVLLNLLIIVPLVTLSFHLSLAYLNSKKSIQSEEYLYDYREIYASHLQFRKWWGTDSLLMFRLKKYYPGVLKYERPDTSDQNYAGLNFLGSFFDKLVSKNSQVRIAYYGDSGIEADLVTQTLRDSLQKIFGGTGVGFLPITSRDPGYRQSINHYFSNLWRWESLENPSPMRKNPGISGNAYYTSRNDSISDQTAWISYRGESFSSRTSFFPTMRFFYGKNENEGSNGDIGWEINDLRQTASLGENELLNEIRLFNYPVSQIRIKADIPSSLPVYGCSIESENGVILDNFALRGIDGSRLVRIPTNLLKEFQRKLNYDLIVFSYGLNVINPARKDFTAYEEKIIRLIKHYRLAFPEIPILIIGPPDKGIGNPGNIVSDPSIPRITKVMRKAAIKSETAFISLYEIMGGNGSMARWVEKERPRLASNDYTHFNYEGADKISQKLLHIFLSETASLNKRAFN
jgi:lysophospholipase L1-like esterase